MVETADEERRLRPKDGGVGVRFIDHEKPQTSQERADRLLVSAVLHQPRMHNVRRGNDNPGGDNFLQTLRRR